MRFRCKHLICTVSICRGFIRRDEHSLLTLSTTRLEQCSGHSTNFIDGEEVKKFNKLAGEWWEETSPVASLRSMNRLRVPLVKNTLLRKSKCQRTAAVPLKGFKILDVGCGGGFLSEALAHIGASVTGIDPGQENINVAMHHAALDSRLLGHLTYKCTSLHELEDVDNYDAVVASEVIEHVPEQSDLIEAAVKLLKPGGYFFLTTINRTLASLVLAKVTAEYIMGVLPPGSHDWNKFVTTDEMCRMLHQNGLTNITFQGMGYNPLTRKWYWTENTGMNYACYAMKPE